MGKKRTRSRQQIPVAETKAERFVRVVTPRVAKAMKAIKVIGYCSAVTYEYTPAQVKQITMALANAIERVNKQFTEKKTDEEEFDFVG